MVWVIVIFCAALLLCLWGWWRAHTRVGRSNRSRQVVAMHAERDAEILLGHQAYRVLERQVSRRWEMLVDGEAREVMSRADLVVEDARGRLWVAEVKSGERAPNPTLPATRRQLMEYLHAFDVAGVLLVDMEARQIHRVAFPCTGLTRRPR